VTEPTSNALDTARQEAGLSMQDFFLRYFGLGGMTPALEMEAVVCGALATTGLDHDRMVHALNERFTELGRNHPVPYADGPGAAP
jgi:hypothetical protein